MTYEINYTMSGSITIDANSPEQAMEIMVANCSQEIIGSLDLGSLKVSGISTDDGSGSEIDPDMEEYVRRAV